MKNLNYRENVNGGCEFRGCQRDAEVYDGFTAFCQTHADQIQHEDIR